ncbi:WbqC family protein [Wenyingzhuangia sp. IMCC45533]
MSKNILVQPAYFATIAQYAAILKAEAIHFELCDHFLKQTYRTRCYIYAANGKLLLNVPVNKTKGKKTLTPQIALNYTEDWQTLHFKSLQSAYQNSPFFEFYQDDLRKIFDTQYQYLGELHNACHHFVMEALQENVQTNYTQEYLFETTSFSDFRDLINSKKQTQANFPKYTQMFDDKHGFIANLSILDLIFMEGPASSMYLNKVEFNL